MFVPGLKKELKFFTRGFRMWGLILVVIGVAFSYPLMYKALEVMTDTLKDIGGSMAGDEMNNAIGSIDGMMSGMAGMYGGSMANVGFFTGVNALSTIAFLIETIILMPVAGGEQKKRSVIIPNCSGLTPAGYVLPKFVLYPLLLTVFTFVGTILTGLLSNALFDNSITFDQMLFTGGCAAGYELFMISVYFLFGISTGRPGVGVIVINVAAEFLPAIFSSILKIEKYTPFALFNMEMQSLNDADMNNFVLSFAVCAIISVICAILSLVIVTVRRIDNSGTGANL